MNCSNPFGRRVTRYASIELPTLFSHFALFHALVLDCVKSVSDVNRLNGPL